ncbi:hypothetical protein HAX54_040453 [Datura stramonium]|uniref:Uncharacterized protein n=1 Tax=Datura stramonium TaxID=4076 RepID=A0ABS8SKC2_DATST|nr:hypothetical protein [Datura stramonium]
MKASIPSQSIKVISKSKNSKSKDTQVNKGVKSPSLTPKEANVTSSEAIDVAHKRKKPASSSDKDSVAGSTMPLTELAHQGQVTNESPSTKLTLPPSKNIELSQPNLSTNVEVRVNQIRCSNTSKDLVRHLQRIVSNFRSEEPISTFKLSYVFGMWHTLCECITQFYVESSESLKELEKGIALILKGLREVNIIDLSPLDVLLEDFFKKHGDYDAARLFTS